MKLLPAFRDGKSVAIQAGQKVIHSQFMRTGEGCSLGLHMFPLYVEPAAIRARAASKHYRNLMYYHFLHKRYRLT